MAPRTIAIMWKTTASISSSSSTVRELPPAHRSTLKSIAGSSTLQGQGDPPRRRPLASIPTFANYLVNGYYAWSGYNGTDPRHWAHPNNLTVNISGPDMPPSGPSRRQRSALWHDVCQRHLHLYHRLRPTSPSYNNGSGDAAHQYSVSGSFLTNATVNISSDWSRRRLQRHLQLLLPDLRPRDRTCAGPRPSGSLQRQRDLRHRQHLHQRYTALVHHVVLQRKTTTAATPSTM